MKSATYITLVSNSGLPGINQKLDVLTYAYASAVNSPDFLNVPKSVQRQVLLETSTYADALAANPAASLAQKSMADVTARTAMALARASGAIDANTPSIPVERRLGQSMTEAMIGAGIAAAKGKSKEIESQVVSTATIWNSIHPTHEVYPGSVITRSFELALPNGQTVFVAPNATKHLVELAQIKSVDYAPESVRLATQLSIAELQGAVSQATRNGVLYDQLIVVGRWELKFSPARQAGGLPVLFHAQPR